MFRSKTILVLGAGASVEVGLPTGPKLLEIICNFLNIYYDLGQLKTGDHILVDALRHHFREGGKVDQISKSFGIARQIRQSAQQGASIDNILDALEDRDAELLGKLAIVRAIQNAERTSRAFEPKNPGFDAPDMKNFSKSWYRILTQLLVEQVKRSQIDDVCSNLSIINFNYDRCLEHYLTHSLAEYYGVDVEHTRKIVDRLPVFRPYGSVGRLPWQSGDGPDVGFGNPTNEHLVQVAQQIRTFTEQKEWDQLSAMRATIREADKIVFLGFGFHRQNVDVLRQKNTKARVLGTALGVSKSDQKDILRDLSIGFNVDLTLPKVRDRYDLTEHTCAEFFEHFRRTLNA